MKKRYLTSLLLLGLMPFLTHCASQDDVNALNYHIRTLNKKVETMKEDTTVDQMQKRQASSSGMMDQLHNDILQLRSQLEENGHMTRMLQEQNKELQQAVSNLKEQQEQQLNTRMAGQESGATRSLLRQARTSAGTSPSMVTPTVRTNSTKPGLSLMCRRTNSCSLSLGSLMSAN